MLNDLRDLQVKHKVTSAEILYETVKEEVEDELLRINKRILTITEKRKDWVDWAKEAEKRFADGLRGLQIKERITTEK